MGELPNYEVHKTKSHSTIIDCSTYQFLPPFALTAMEKCSDAGESIVIEVRP
jgi:hypothetical protein